jgi:hypothetical protein
MSLVSQKISRPATASAVLFSMVDQHISQATADLKAGDGSKREVKIGLILAKVTIDASTVANVTADPDNVGDGTLTMDASPFTDGTREGTYVVQCITAGGDGVAKFSVEKPDGGELNKATAGTLTTQHVRFTIAAGATPFSEGDKFLIEVTTTDGKADQKIVAWDPNDKNQELWGISLVNASALDGVDNVNGVTALTRMGVIKRAGIIWPDGISTQDQEEVLSWLDEKRQIVTIN